MAIKGVQRADNIKRFGGVILFCQVSLADVQPEALLCELCGNCGWFHAFHPPVFCVVELFQKVSRSRADIQQATASRRTIAASRFRLSFLKFT